MPRLLLVISLLFNLTLGYLIGYNEGWDAGHLVGFLDTKFKFNHYTWVDGKGWVAD